MGAKLRERAGRKRKRVGRQVLTEISLDLELDTRVLQGEDPFDEDSVQEGRGKDEPSPKDHEWSADAAVMTDTLTWTSPDLCCP